jgi:hypothetical protein
MKNNNRSLSLLSVLLSMVTFNLYAQLSGVITINSGAPVSATNYTSFTALASDLNTMGINGPLTVDVVASSGPYNEHPSFGVIAGVSSTNTITINGNGNVLTYSATAITSAWTLNLHGADHMSFNNLTVVGTGTLFAYACVLSSGADYNTFTACTFSCPLIATASSQYAVMINGNNSGAQTFANSASYTIFKSCTMIGGYHSVFLCGPNGVPPYSTKNTFDNCIMRDFNYYGLNSNFQMNLTVTHCTIDRPTRNTNGGTIYATQIISSQNALVENNLIEKLFDGQLNATTACYGLYFATTASVVGQGYNTYRNNVIRDIRSNGAVYGIYGQGGGAADGYIHHNTVSLDHTGSTATGSTVGIYIMGNTGYLTDVRNNCVSITRGGTGGKYCFYNNTLGYCTVDYNNYYMNAGAGANYIGYYGLTACSNLAALQALGLEANGLSTDPIFTSLPSNLIPTSSVMNDHGTPVGTVTDHLDLNRSGSTPDMGAYEFLSSSCSGVPTATSITAPSQTVCFGETVNLLLDGATSDLGITYQWLSSSSSSSGPWTVISGANTAAYISPAITANIYYGVEVNCTLGGGSATVAAVVNLAATTTSTVPYYEGFEGVTKTNKLPNCSWSASSPGNACLTYTSSFYMPALSTSGRTPRTGNKFASFFWSPLGDQYFYTNGIHLNAGVTYSTGLWYQTDFNLYNNFADMSILYGTTQSTAGLVPIVSTNGPATSAAYKSISNTFTVPVSGIYYIAIKSSYPVASSAAAATYLSWDDLFITIPCSLNTPSITVSASAGTICSTQSVVLTATGADNFLWNTGATTKVITEYPINSAMYTASGTSTLSGCISNNATHYVVVNPSPSVFADASNSSSVCAGSSINLSALGNALTYTWSTGSSDPKIIVTPSVSASYTLYGSNSFSCVANSVLPITVLAQPTITASGSAPTQMCAGETRSLTATGGVTYQWVASPSGLVFSGATINVAPAATTIYTVTGTNAAGCSNTFALTQNVSECLGIDHVNGSLARAIIYPNPTAGEIRVQLNNSSLKSIEITDVTGRLMTANSSTSDIMKIDLSGLPNGIYYVRIQSNDGVEVIKILKQ